MENGTKIAEFFNLLLCIIKILHNYNDQKNHLYGLE